MSGILSIKRGSNKIKKKLSDRTKKCKSVAASFRYNIISYFCNFCTVCILEAGKENVHWGVSMENTKKGCC